MATTALIPYHPSWAIRYMHERIKRYDASRGMAQSSSTFALDEFTTTNGRNYATGIGTSTAAYVTVGILLFCIFGIVFCIGCCCAKKHRKPYPKARASTSFCARACTEFFSSRSLFGIALLSMLACGAAVLSLISGFQTSINGTVTGVDHFQANLEGFNVRLTSTAASLLLTSNAGTTLASLLPNGATKTQLNAIISTIVSSTATLQSNIGALDSVSDTIDRNLPKADINRYKRDIGLFGYITVGVFMGVIALMAFGLIGKRCNAKFFRFYSPICLLSLTLGVYIFTGIFLFISLAGADACYEPTNIVNRLNLGATVNYYTTCGDSGVAAPPAGIYLDVVNSQNETVTLKNTVNIFAGSFTPSSPAQRNALNSFVLNANTSANTFLVTGYVDCPAMYNIYTEILHSLCDDGITTIIKVWAIATAACVAFGIMLITGVMLCCSHPGDPRLFTGDMKGDDAHDNYHMAGEPQFEVAQYGEDVPTTSMASSTQPVVERDGGTGEAGGARVGNSNRPNHSWGTWSPSTPNAARNDLPAKDSASGRRPASKPDGDPTLESQNGTGGAHARSHSAADIV